MPSDVPARFMDGIPTRRQLIASGGLIGLMGLAGCSLSAPGQSGDDDGGEEPDDTDDSDGNGESDRDDDNSPPDEEAVDGDLLDDFESLHRWSNSGVSLVADTNRSLVGSQSGTFRVGHPSTRGYIARRFDPPIDLTDRGLRLGLRAAEPLDPWVRAFDGRGNRLDYRASVPGDRSLYPHDLGLIDVDGDPNLSEIREIRILTQIEEDADNQLWCDELRLTDKIEPTVTLHFDRTLASIHSTVLPIMNEYGLTGSAFVNSEFVGREARERERLTENQIGELHDAGWAICSGARRYTHLDTLDDDRKEVFITSTLDWLRARGYDEGAPYLGLPFGSYDDATLELVSEYHDYGFIRGWGGHGRVGHPALIPRRPEPSPGTATKLIDFTAEYGGVLSFSWDGLASRDIESFEAVIAHLADLASEGAVRVASVTEIGDDFVE